MGHENQFDLKVALEQAILYLCRGFNMVDGTITAINNDNTCDVTVGDQTFFSAPICVLIGAQASIYPIPVLGTNCLLNFRDGNFSNPQIVAIHQVDKWLINCNLVQYNGGNKGGIPVTPDVVDRLNKIENAYNDLVEKFNAHSHILTLTSGTGTAAPTTDQETTTLTPTQATDIESKVITQ